MSEIDFKAVKLTAFNHGADLLGLGPEARAKAKKKSSDQAAGERYFSDGEEAGETGENDPENEPGKRKTKPAGTAEQTEDLDEQWADLLQKIREGKL